METNANTREELEMIPGGIVPTMLRELKEAGVSYSDLARMFGIDRSPVSQWLHGSCSPDDDKARAICALHRERCGGRFTDSEVIADKWLNYLIQVKGLTPEQIAHALYRPAA